MLGTSSATLCGSSATGAIQLGEVVGPDRKRRDILPAMDGGHPFRALLDAVVARQADLII
jgi:hypothetical protein